VGWDGGVRAISRGIQLWSSGAGFVTSRPYALASPGLFNKLDEALPTCLISEYDVGGESWGRWDEVFHSGHAEDRALCENMFYCLQCGEPTFAAMRFGGLWLVLCHVFPCESVPSKEVNSSTENWPGCLSDP
jgi:hypothetical protein